MNWVDAIRDPWIVAAAVFTLGLLVTGLVLLVTTGRRWHDRHHTDRTELMCDHCMTRWRGGVAPPLRVFGDPRR